MSDHEPKLQALIDELSAASDSDLLLLQLDPESGQKLRLCAIPHVVDARVLCALDPSLNEEQASGVLSEFQSLSGVIETPDGLALHDVIRRQLFAWWLQPERRGEFEAASRRLTEFFELRLAEQPDSLSLQNSIIFHSLGASLNEGFTKFRQVFEQRRDRSQFSNAEALLPLVREYSAILSHSQISQLIYCEVESALDGRDWNRVLLWAKQLDIQDTPVELRYMLLFYIGIACRKLRHFDEARDSCEKSILLANNLGHPSTHLIYNELGLIARDEGNYDEAKKCFESALSLALSQSTSRDVAMAYNSLGTLMIRTEPEQALTMFEQAFSRLNKQSDSFSVAQVLNNKAIAYANLSNWQLAEEAYQHSLEIKRTANDLFGQATTSLNIARVFDAEGKRSDAQKSLSTAAELFEALHALSDAASARRELARLLLKAGERVEAEAVYAQAVSLFQRAGDSEQSTATAQEFGRPASRRRFWRRILSLKR
jgi:tetratricopeptide (TPR) repeat protein